MSAKVSTRIGLFALALAALAAAVGAALSAAQSSGDGCDSRCKADLERARAATEKFRDVTVAIREGFVQSSQCGSADTGTLGIQYTNLERSSDRTIDPEEPESLLYMPQGNTDSRRLVALEYSVPDEGQAPPMIFGREFSGPEKARTLGLRDQYVLRVWLYSENPDGLFAPANRDEACDRETLVEPDGEAEGCLEVTGTISLPADRVREVGNVPERFELQPGARPDSAQVNVGTHFCDSFTWDDGTTLAPLMFGHYTALLQPPDYVGVDVLDSRYLVRLILNDGAKALRQRMGVSADVIAQSDEIVRDFNPILGIDPNYQFSTPDFVLNAAASETDPGEPGPFTVRFFRDTVRGTAKLRVWVDSRAGPQAAVVRVTPRPGSLLAKMAGCDAGAGSCDPILADSGLMVSLDTAYRFTAR